MKLNYYVAEDLRIPPGRIVATSQVCRFQDWHDALEYYRNLPMTRTKELGAASGSQMLRLVRCLPLTADTAEGEDILVIDQLLLPMWRKYPSILEKARDCVECLNIRHCLDGDRIVPSPTILTAGAVDPYLRMEGKPAIRWIFVAGDGWLSPAQFEQRYPESGHGSRYPLVLKYRISGMMERHRPVTLEIAPLDYKRLARYAGQRRSQY